MISVNGTQVGTVTSNMITADPLSGLVINSGDAITFEASSTAGAGLEITDFRIESFTVDVQAIPEPSSLALLATMGIGFVVRRRR